MNPRAGREAGPFLWAEPRGTVCKISPQSVSDPARGSALASSLSTEEPTMNEIAANLDLQGLSPRRLTPQDLELICRHRQAMFLDAGQDLPPCS